MARGLFHWSACIHLWMQALRSDGAPSLSCHPRTHMSPSKLHLVVQGMHRMATAAFNAGVYWLRQASGSCFCVVPACATQQRSVWWIWLNFLPLED